MSTITPPEEPIVWEDPPEPRRRSAGQLLYEAGQARGKWQRRIRLLRRIGQYDRWARFDTGTSQHAAQQAAWRINDGWYGPNVEARAHDGSVYVRLTRQTNQE